jgi:transcriptional regulator with XRE-family HTH domain
MRTVMTDDIRHAVKVELAKRKLTQGELAKGVGITVQQLSRMMQGKSAKVPDSWQSVFDFLGLELVVKAKSE